VIQLQRTDQAILVSVCDDGPGVPMELREQLLKPFERGSASDSDGYGLGLAVAARISKYHNGYLKIDTCTHLGGAKVSVYLQN